MKKVLLFILFFISGIMVANAAITDNKAPEIHSFKPTSTSAKQGDIVSFVVDAEDDISGINEILIDYIIEDPNGLYTYMIVGLSKKGMKPSNGPEGLNDFQNGKHTYSGYIPSTTKLGTYKLFTIHILDANRNTTNYCVGDHFCSLYEGAGYKKLDIDYSMTIAKGNVDNEPPTLKEFKVSTNNAKVGEEVKYTVKATDPSGIKEVALFVDNNSYLLSKVANDTYEVTVTFNTAGTHVFKQLSLMDEKNNDGAFFYKSQKGIYSEENNKFDFENGKYDVKVTGADGSTTTADPVLNKIVISKTKVTPPGVIDIYYYASPNSEVRIVIYNKDKEKNTNGIHINQAGWQKDKYVYHLELNQYTEPGRYCIEAVVMNDFGYEAHYTSRDDYKPNGIVKKLDKEYYFDVVEDYKSDVATSITNNSIEDKIKNAKEGAVIAIDTTKSTKVKKSIFEAIKGTNKTIVLESNGIQWHFNGKDITNPKDISIDTKISYVEKYIEEFNEDENGELIETWRNEKALVLEFPQNGDLPGKALIKVKADYAFRQYLNSDDLFLYYQHGDMYDIISENIMASYDEFYEFYLDHNSTYYLTNKKLADKKIKQNRSEKLGNKKLAKKVEKEKKEKAPEAPVEEQKETIEEETTEEKNENVENQEKIETTGEEKATNDTKNTKKNKLGLLIGIPVGLLIVIGVIAVLIIKKNNNKKRTI